MQIEEQELQHILKEIEAIYLLMENLTIMIIGDMDSM